MAVCLGAALPVDLGFGKEFGNVRLAGWARLGDLAFSQSTAGSLCAVFYIPHPLQITYGTPILEHKQVAIRVLLWKCQTQLLPSCIQITSSYSPNSASIWAWELSHISPQTPVPSRACKSDDRKVWKVAVSIHRCTACSWTPSELAHAQSPAKREWGTGSVELTSKPLMQAALQNVELPMPWHIYINAHWNGFK